MVLSRNQASLVDITAVHMNMMIIMMILVEPAASGRATAGSTRAVPGVSAQTTLARRPYRGQFL